MAEVDAALDGLVESWSTVPDFADQIGEPITKVRQLLRDGKIVGLRRADGVFAIPAAFAQDDTLIKGLGGTLTVLHDSGYTPEEAIRWLFTPDDSLPGTPVQALRENRGTEVRRRAQALAF